MEIRVGQRGTAVTYTHWTSFVVAEVELADTSRLRDIINGCRLAANRLAADDERWSVVEGELQKALDALPEAGDP